MTFSQPIKLTKSSRIYVAGHRGLVGSAVVRALKKRHIENLIVRDRNDLDLKDRARVRQFFQDEQPEIVVLAAARVGGIGANSTYPVDFLLDNLEIQNNVISAAADFNTKKLVFLGSSCIYPKEAKYPLTEDQLLAGPLEPTNEPYALAKIAGIKLCEAYRTQKSKNFISVMPTNLFGPNDYYDRENSHVIPAMLMKVLEAKKEKRKSVKFWGTGKAYREFLYSDDLAEAILLCIEKYNERELINVGSGAEISIKDLGELVCKVASFDGAIEWDQDHPDGVMRKPLDSKKIQALGWAPKINLEEGLRSIMSEALAAVEAANLSLPRHHIGG